MAKLFNYLLLIVTSIWILASCCPASSLGKNSIEQENKRITVSYIEEVLNKRRLDLIKDIFSPDYTFHGSDGTERKSIEKNTLIPFLEYLFKAFPDLHYSIDDVIASGDKVALSLRASGTHQNEFLGFAASGNKINFKEMFFFRLVKGKITDGWAIVNVENLKDQLKKK